MRRGANRTKSVHGQKRNGGEDEESIAKLHKVKEMWYAGMNR